MSYTLTSAAAATGLNRTTVLRAIKSGKISAAKDEHGEWTIDPAELHRVYPPVTRNDEPQRGRSNEDIELQIRTTLAEARLADLKSILEDMRSQRDHWQAMAQRLAITDQRPRSPPPPQLPKPAPAPAAPQPLSWWRRLAG